MKVGNHVMRLDPHINQTSPNKGKYRVICTAKDLAQPPQWIGKVEKFCWIVMIKYLETNEKVNLFFDHYDKCYKKEKV